MSVCLLVFVEMDFVFYVWVVYKTICFNGFIF